MTQTDETPLTDADLQPILHHAPRISANRGSTHDGREITDIIADRVGRAHTEELVDGIETANIRFTDN